MKLTRKNDKRNLKQSVPPLLIIIHSATISQPAVFLIQDMNFSFATFKLLKLNLHYIINIFISQKSEGNKIAVSIYLNMKIIYRTF